MYTHLNWNPIDFQLTLVFRCAVCLVCLYLVVGVSAETEAREGKSVYTGTGMMVPPTHKRHPRYLPILSKETN